MTDFDDVLERLLADPAFPAELAADPQSALAGYRLDADERDLLLTQYVAGTGGDRTVEMRTSKSGVVGLLGPVVAAFGVATGATTGASTAANQSLGAAPDAPGSATFGAAPQVPAAESFGVAGGGASQTFGDSAPTQGLGEAGGGHSFGSAPVEATNYHTRVDVDGDGTWDANIAYERPDGGVDITVDINHDGVADFVGHDTNRDGLVDSAEFDTDLDATMDTRMYDDTGDGWMDRSERIA